jgi:hypothetical protein
VTLHWTVSRSAEPAATAMGSLRLGGAVEGGSHAWFTPAPQLPAPGRARPWRPGGSKRPAAAAARFHRRGRLRRELRGYLPADSYGAHALAGSKQNAHGGWQPVAAVTGSGTGEHDVPGAHRRRHPAVPGNAGRLSLPPAGDQPGGDRCRSRVGAAACGDLLAGRCSREHGDDRWPCGRAGDLRGCGAGSRHCPGRAGDRGGGHRVGRGWRGGLPVPGGIPGGSGGGDPERGAW